MPFNGQAVLLVYLSLGNTCNYGTALLTSRLHILLGLAVFLCDALLGSGAGQAVLLVCAEITAEVHFLRNVLHNPQINTEHWSKFLCSSK